MEVIKPHEIEVFSDGKYSNKKIYNSGMSLVVCYWI